MGNKQKSQYADFGLALENVTKEVNIQIAKSDFETLKKSKYKLCFAKHVNDEYDVVWQSYSDYLSNNYFSWTPQFQLFGTNNFISGLEIRTSTNVESCGLGKTCTLNETGLLEKQLPGGTIDALTINNEYGSIHGGVKQLSIGISSEMTSSAVYVAKSKEVKGDILLTPKDIVRIWFQQDLETSTMISKKPSSSIDIDLTSEQSATCLYKDQEWTLIESKK